jgi:prepilin-type N-terminal cleavage/methylation domain-containing protein
MLARIRKSMEEKDQGFTLIELLVVIIIIGILAAIAIPIFLNQRKKAVASSMKEDLHTIATAEETYYVDNQAYFNGTGVPADLKTSTGNAFAYTVDANHYCIVATNAGADPATLVYNSAAGGLQPSTTTTCS